MSKQLTIHNGSGSEVGQINLDEQVFGIEPNIHVMHLALRRQLSNGRGGNACAKTRSEVKGGGKKPWKQKGTGRARAGSLRSPLFAGGGVIFGPKPRKYDISMNVKARRLALRSALSARTEDLVVIKDFSELTQPKTKDLVKLLAKLNVEGKVLVIADYKSAENQHLELAARNIPSIRIILSSNLNVKDVLEADKIIITETSINDVTERLTRV